MKTVLDTFGDSRGNEIDYYDIEQYWQPVIDDLIKEFEVKGSIDFMVEGKISNKAIVAINKEKIEEYSHTFDSNETIIDMVIDLFKEDRTTEEISDIGNFILLLMDLDEYSLPGEFGL
jgi:hypothetical protein